MSVIVTTYRKALLCTCGVGAAICFLAGCARSDRDQVQGYVEGEFVYVASPLAGVLESLYVQKGAVVKAGDPLFALESVPEKAARDEAQRRLAQASSYLADVKKGKRPSEIEAIVAQLKQVRAALALSEKEFERQERLVGEGAIAQQSLDRARAARDGDRQRVVQIEADLTTAQLGARSDQVAAAEASMRAQKAVLERAQWEFSQKRRTAPKAGLVFDTLFREGEWVGAGRPIVVLLPPENVKVRTFVQEARIGAIHPGDRVRISVDGVREPLYGKVSFISPQAEYTPPVIYSRESRGKMVFMIEATLDPGVAGNIHPGQPVDVQFDRGAW